METFLIPGIGAVRTYDEKLCWEREKTFFSMREDSGRFFLFGGGMRLGVLIIPPQFGIRSSYQCILLTILILNRWSTFWQYGISSARGVPTGYWRSRYDEVSGNLGGIEPRFATCCILYCDAIACLSVWFDSTRRLRLTVIDSSQPR